MALALYRKYRPRTFAEVIGQDHVTEPLSQALRSGRLHHAYLFSGPRGCGKTSSARILARSLNCEQGPTPDPCGVCASCRSLANDGAGSIDVIEIDAASHGGVDDARELREKAFFAPASSRYKIYVIDEAHMVSSAGFNALLKLVEEPPEYVKFIFATTEPEKVLGTIRSRTHHYPFRLIPPAVLRPYLQQLTEAEGIHVEPAVYPLVVRAGGGSARDTLSVLDQLIAGAGPDGVSYARAVNLLGVTDVALIDEMCDALAAGDGAAAYSTIDRVAEAGHDPRRFASDLLERFRDLIILQQVPDAVAKGLIDGPADQLDAMNAQATRLGPATLSRCADIVHNGLVEMRGTTAPRLLLELITARMLLPGADDSTGALLQRLERMERRLTLSDSSDVRHDGATSSPPVPQVAGVEPAAALGSRGGLSAARAAAAAAGRRAPAGGLATGQRAPGEGAGGAASDGSAGGAASGGSAGGAGSGGTAGGAATDGSAGGAALGGSGRSAGGVAGAAGPAGETSGAAGPHGGGEVAAASGSAERGGGAAAAGDSQRASGASASDAAPGAAEVAKVRHAAESSGPAAGPGETPAGTDARSAAGPGMAGGPGADGSGRSDTAGAQSARPASGAGRGGGASEYDDDEWPDEPPAFDDEPAPASSRPVPPQAAPTSGGGYRPDPGAILPDAPDDGVEPAGAPGQLSAAAVREVWPEIVTAVSRQSKKVAALASGATVRDLDGQTVVLTFRFPAHAKMVADQPQLLVDALYEALGGRWQIRCEVAGDGGPAPRSSGPSRGPAPAQPGPQSAATGQGASPARQRESAPKAASRPSSSDDGDDWPEPARPGGSAVTAPQPAATSDDDDWPEPARPGGAAPTDRSDPAPSAEATAATGADRSADPARDEAMNRAAAAVDALDRAAAADPAPHGAATPAATSGAGTTARERAFSQAAAGDLADPDQAPDRGAGMDNSGRASGAGADEDRSGQASDGGTAAPGRGAAAVGGAGHASDGGAAAYGSGGGAAADGANHVSAGGAARGGSGHGSDGGSAAAGGPGHGLDGGSATAGGPGHGSDGGSATAGGPGLGSDGSAAAPRQGQVAERGGADMAGNAGPSAREQAMSRAAAAAGQVASRTAAPERAAKPATEPAAGRVPAGRPASPGLAAARAAAAAGANRQTGGKPKQGNTWSDGSSTEEAPYDPEFDGPPKDKAKAQGPAQGKAGYDGFDPGDEPLDEVIDERSARQNSEQQAVDLLREAFGAEKIGETQG